MSISETKNQNLTSSGLDKLENEIKNISEKTWYALKENVEWLGSNLKSGASKVINELDYFAQSVYNRDFQCDCQTTDNNYDNHLNCHCQQDIL